MKKTNLLIMMLTVLLSMVSNKAFAYDIAVENEDGVKIYYNYISDGKELEVTCLATNNSNKSAYSGNVVIPEEVTYMNRTRKVTNIAGYAFYHCIHLTSVTIPNSVTSICKFAFWECTSLTSIAIPNSVTIIENGAFGYCSGLTSVAIPDSVTSIGDNAFEGCNNLTSVSIGNSVTSIGGMAFSGCEALTSIVIPNSVTSIGWSAFKGCTGLTYIVSLIENPFKIKGKPTDNRTFELDVFYNITLYVPVGTIDKYKETSGWTDFVYIEEIDGSDLKQCAKPTIYYSEGKLSYKSETEGVTFHSTISDTDMGAYSDDEVQLTVTYHISVYATKAGYLISDVAEATLCWIEVDPQKEGITEETATGAKQLKALPVLIQAADGQISVEGVSEGTKVAVYDASGVEMGAAISRGGTTLIPTRLASGTIAIVKIGEKAVKLAIK